MENTTFYIYAIASIEKDWIYVGMTENIIRRVNEHQRGKEKTTKWDIKSPTFIFY